MSSMPSVMAAANLTALKDELIDVVSAFLLKEPPLNQEPSQVNKGNASSGAAHNVGDAPKTQTLPHAASAPTTPAPVQSTSPVPRIRTLVHLISQHDGEFVLKLALYVRHDLRIRNTTNFLVALCAREPKCLPFLEGYMEKTVVLPSDWLAVASFAYYFDSDAAHQPEQHSTATSTATDAATVPAQPVIPAALRRALVARFQSFTEFSLAKYNNEAALKRRKYKAKNKYNQALRAAAKERSAQRTAQKELNKQLLNIADLFEGTSSPASEQDASEGSETSMGEARMSNDDDDDDDDEDDEDDEEPGATALFVFPRERTFTYKQLVRHLHMDTPAYLICCLLGKRYPDTFEAFDKMNLNEPASHTGTGAATPTKAAHAFDPALAGTRMRLRVPETWETELAKSGNTGAVWDRLYSKKAVPFMAMLRNLRNVLTRNVSEATHRTILRRLTAEDEVAASAQMPHRFLSAFYAAREALADHDLTRQWQVENDERAKLTSERYNAYLETQATRGRGRGRGYGLGYGRGRGRPSFARGQGPLPPLRFPKARGSQGVIHQCEMPLPSEEEVQARVEAYEKALNRAIMISLRLNVQPLPGSALVVLCVWPSMRKPLKAVGGGPVGSLRTKLELAVLLAVMVKQCAEDGTVLVTCYDKVRPFQPPRFAEQGLLDSVLALKALCEDMLDVHAASAGPQRGRAAAAASTSAESLSSRGGSASGTVEGSADGEKEEAEEAERGAESREDTDSEAGSRMSCGWVERVEGAERARPDAAPTAAEREGATFPFFRLDEVIERRLTLESLVVIDEGHHTYGCMNTDAPSLGDLPVYLHRLRHTSSPNLVFVAVSTSSDAKPAPTTAAEVSPSSPSSAPAQRYTHRNDVVLTGFSDAILRLIAERGRGGPRPYIERADEVFQVDRFAGHQRQRRRRAQQQRALQSIQKSETAQAQQRRASCVVGDVLKGMDTVEESVLSPFWPYTKPQDSVDGVSEAPGLTHDSTSLTRSASGTHRPATTTTTTANAMLPTSALSGSLRLLSDDDGLRALTDRAEAALRMNGPRAETESSGVETFTSPRVYQPTPFIMVSKASSRAGPDGKRLLAHKMQSLAKSHASPTGAGGLFSPVSTSATATMSLDSRASPPPPSAHRSMTTPLQEEDSTAVAARARTGRSLDHVPRALSAFYECRFFISSTFLDMNNERNALTLDVFPRLRRWAGELGLRVNLVEMDLRWGITEAATNEHLSTSVCLNNVSRCAPFFIGMLGDRYGSCPTPLSIVVDEDVPIEDYAWLETLADVDKDSRHKSPGSSATNTVSVTDLEMRHGVYTSRRRLLPSSPPATVFFARDSAALQQSLPKDERRAVYAPDTPTSLARIARLKRFLDSEGVPLIDYTATFTEGTRTSGVSATGAPAGASAVAADNTTDTAGPTAPSSSSHPGASDGGESLLLLHDGAALENEMRNTWGSRLPSSIPSYLDLFTPHHNHSGAQGSVASSAATACGAPRYLTSQDVLLDMTDFTRKAFFALRAIISQVCGVPLVVGPQDADGAKAVQDDDAAAAVTAEATEGDAALDARTTRPPRATPLSARPTGEDKAPPHDTPATHDFFSRQQEALQLYREDLCKVYVPPPHLLEQLAGFALQGNVPHVLLDASDGGGASAAPEVSSPTAAAAAASWRLTAEADVGSTETGDSQAALATALGLDVVGRTTSPVLVMTGRDGDGKSSALAALATRLQDHQSDAQGVVYYALQADGSNSMQLQSLVLCLALDLVRCAGLSDEIHIDESEAASHLVQRFPDIYHAINRRGDVNVVVLLDGPERCFDAAALLQHMGWLVSPTAAPAVRFIIATEPDSPFAEVFATRLPPAVVCPLPFLALPERADLVRRHLTLYGKVLQETIDVNELNALLHKRDASHPSYLTAAILYLRLFSAFDTLRQDIRQLPTTIGALYRRFFTSLEGKFHASTCRLVLTTLSLRESAGGVMEHTLYRLVANLAVASGLVDLLTTTGLTASRRGQLTLRNSFFATAIVNTYCPTSADAVAAREALILAELLYQPLRPATDVQQTRQMLRRVVTSIRLSAADPSAPRLFNPARYASHELLSVLHDAARAGRADIVLALVGYLPFLECLLEATTTDMARSSGNKCNNNNNNNNSGSRSRHRPMRLAQLMGILVPLCSHRSTEVAVTAQSLVHFCQQHYQTLLRRPDLLVQCVRNMPSTFQAISRYSMADYVHWGSCHRSGPDTDEQGRTSTASATTTMTMTAALSGGEARHAAHLPPKQGEDEVLDHLLLHLRAVPAPHTRPSRGTGKQHGVGSGGGEEDDVWVQWENMDEHGTGMRLSSFRPAASQSVLCLATSPDGMTLALGFPDGCARVAPLSAPDQLKAALKHVSAVTAVAFLPSRPNTLVTGCAKGLVYVWSLEDNALLQVGAAHLRCVSAIAAHPHESFICTGSHDAHAMLWDLLGTTSTPHSLLDAAVEDAAREAARGQRGSVPPTTTTTSAVTAMTTTRRGPGGIPANRFGAMVLGGRRRTQLQPFHVLRHHRAALSSVAFHRAGDVLATGAWDHTVFLVELSDLASGPRQMRDNDDKGTNGVEESRRYTPRFASMKFVLASPVRVLQFAPSMVITCAAGTYSGAISLVDFASGLESCCLTNLHHAPVSALSFSPDGKLLASADVSGQLRVSYAGVTGTVLGTLNGHRDAITGLHFTTFKDRHLLLSSGLDATVQEWRVETQRTAPEVPTAHAAAVTCVAVSADGSAYVTGSADGTAFVFRRRNAEGPLHRAARAPRQATSAMARARRLAIDTDTEETTAPTVDGIGEDDDGGSDMIDHQEAHDTEGEQPLPRSEEEAVDQSATVYEPLMSLQHDGWRVTCATFALSNTRILTGVALGDIYVWASQPGLSRREGRLLFRLPGPRQGIYPVIALTANDLVPGVSVWGTAGAGEARTGSLAVAPPASTSRVTGLCSNGDTVHFNVYTSAVSLALQQRDDKQQQTQQHKHQQRRPSPAAESSPSRHKAAPMVDLIDDLSDASADGLAASTTTTSRIGAAVPSARLNAPRRVDTTAERVHHVQRQRLKWQLPPTGASCALESETVTAAPSTVVFGEELLAAIPLAFRCESHAWHGPLESPDEVLGAASTHTRVHSGVEPHPAGEATEPEAVRGTRDVRFGWAGTGSGGTYLQVMSHDALVVGRRHFLAASFRDNAVSVLAVRKAPSLVWHDADFDTHWRLADEDALVAVTEVCPVRGAAWQLLCAATDHGALLFFCVAKRRRRPAQSQAAVAGTEVPQVWLWHTTRVCESRAAEPTADATGYDETARWAEAGEDVSTAPYLHVDALALSLSTPHTTSSAGSGEADAETLDVVVACRDGSTRVLSLAMSDVLTALAEVDEVMEREGHTAVTSEAGSASVGRSPLTAQSPGFPLPGGAALLSRQVSAHAIARGAAIASPPPPPPPPSRATARPSPPPSLAAPPASLATAYRPAPGSWRRGGSRGGHTAGTPLRATLERRHDDGDSVQGSAAADDARSWPRLVLVERAILYASAPLKAVAILPRRCASALAPLSWIVGDDVGNVYRLHLEDGRGRWATCVEKAHRPFVLAGAADPTVSLTTSAPARASRSVTHAPQVRLGVPQSPAELMHQQAASMASTLDMLRPANVSGSLARDVATRLRSEDVLMPRVPRTGPSTTAASSPQPLLPGPPPHGTMALYPAVRAPLGGYTTAVAAAGVGTHTDLTAGGPLWAYLHGHGGTAPPWSVDTHATATAASPTTWQARPTRADFAERTMTKDTTWVAEPHAHASPSSPHHATSAAGEEASSPMSEAPTRARQPPEEAVDGTDLTEVVKPLGEALVEKLAALRRADEAVTRLFVHPPRRRRATNAQTAEAAVVVDAPAPGVLTDERMTETTCQEARRGVDVAPVAVDSADDEESYFLPLTMVGPPSTVRGSAESVRAWYQHRQEVLKEAMRVQKYNREAREALKVYNTQSTTALGM